MVMCILSVHNFTEPYQQIVGNIDVVLFYTVI